MNATEGAQSVAIEPDITVKGKPRRIRVTFSVTHGTIQRLDAICLRYGVARGLVVDKLTATYHAMLVAGAVVCADGRPCALGRKDLPEVL